MLFLKSCWLLLDNDLQLWANNFSVFHLQKMRENGLVLKEQEFLSLNSGNGY